MTQTSIREYSEAVRRRYLQSSKKDKGKILDEFSKVMSYHRKAAIRLLRRVVVKIYFISAQQSVL